MLDNNWFFLIHSIVFLLVMTRGVLCEKHSIGDIQGQYNLQNSAETELTTLSHTSIITTSFPRGRNGTSLVEETTNKMELPNTKQIEEKPKFGNTGGNGHGNKKKKSQKRQQGLVQKILPLMIIPFMISTALIPIMFFVVKLLFVKAVFIAKIAVTLGIISYFKRRNNNGGVYNYNAWKMR